MNMKVIDRSLEALVSAITVSFDSKLKLHYPSQQHASSAWIDKLFVEKQTNKHNQLRPVFSEMFDFKETTLTIKPNPTTLAECFPQTNVKFDQVAKSASLKQLENEINSFVQGEITEQTIAQVLAACQQHVRYLPAPTAADYSAYDYIQARTAIEVCDALSDEAEQFCLVEGDISGIQKFIFEVTEGEATRKNVAKSLRGRSAYVNFLSDFIAHNVLHQLGLTRIHLLYSNGGTFQLLIPNTPKYQELLNDAQKVIEEVLYDLFAARLAVVFGAITFDQQQLVADYAQQVQRVKQVVNRQKQKRFINLIHQQKDQFFVQTNATKTHHICQQCGSARTNHEMCKLCNDLIQLGTVLVDQPNAYVTFDFSKSSQAGDCNLEIGTLGTICLHTKKPAVHYGIAINHATIGFEQKMMGNTVAKKRGETLSFEEIAELSQSAEKRLAVLKMDVDNLGFIFSQGFPTTKRQLPRLMSLSRQLDWFFTGYLNELCREVSKQFGHDHAFYINYAGGDDLMVIGPWDLILELSQQIQTKFTAYTCGNPQFTISGGIEIIKPKQPIRIAAHKAEEALELVKQTKTKAGIALLGQKFPWQATETVYTYPKLLSDFKNFEKQIQAELISQTLFYNLMTASNRVNQLIDEETKKTQIIPQQLAAPMMQLIPQIAYSMNRNLGAQKQQELHEELKNRLLVAKNNELAYIQYPFKLVILSQRS